MIPEGSPVASDLARIALARASSRLAVQSAEAGFAQAAIMAFRAELGTCVTQTSRFVPALLDCDGLSVEKLAWHIAPAPGWPFRPSDTGEVALLAHDVRHGRLGAARGGAGHPARGRPGLSVRLGGGGRVRLHVRAHSIEIAGRAGAVGVSTRFGELRIELPGSLPSSLRAASIGRDAADLVELAALRGRGWLVHDLLPPIARRGWTVVVQTGVAEFRMPWASAE